MMASSDVGGANPVGRFWQNSKIGEKVASALVVGCSMATAAVAGHLLGIGIGTSLAVGAAAMGCLFIAKNLTSQLSGNSVAKQIAILVATYLAMHVGAGLVVACAGYSLASSVALSTACNIVLPTTIVNLAMSAAARDRYEESRALIY